MTNPLIGYCCNVHSGVTLDEVKANLQRYSTRVQKTLADNTVLPIGLWFSDSVSGELEVAGASEAFSDWLSKHQLLPYTINGFPFGDFHSTVVKHSVYRPDWADPSRLNYTIRLAKILNRLLPAKEKFATISTLPLGWPTNGFAKSDLDDGDNRFLNQCADQYKTLARELDGMFASTGRITMICIEPEPGCVLDSAGDIVRFFQHYLLTGTERENETMLRHVGVCHDVCHSAVMFEPQTSAVARYTEAGIRIGKAQISSALDVDFSSAEPASILMMLRQFSEPRYLHQTTIRQQDQVAFHEDLNLAIAANATPAGNWRVHFHVPIFAEKLGPLGTTQHQIIEFLSALKTYNHSVPHLEVETYAWNVLPDTHRKETTLEQSISQELEWLSNAMR